MFVQKPNRKLGIKILVETDTEPFNVFYDHKQEMAAINPPNKSIDFIFVITYPHALVELH